MGALQLRVGRAKILDALAAENIGVSIRRILVYLHPYCRRTFGYQEGDYPVAEQLLLVDVEALSCPSYGSE
jgi:dTDP-4-amino-4,6-dideoxygalactose transaminase